MLSRNTKLHIVKASLEDEEGVMRASEDVYAGLDYLPSLYRTWIQEGDKEDPRRFNFVVQINAFKPSACLPITYYGESSWSG